MGGVGNGGVTCSASWGWVCVWVEMLMGGVGVLGFVVV